MQDNIQYLVKNNHLAPDLEENDVIIFRQNGNYQIIKNFGSGITIY